MRIAKWSLAATVLAAVGTAVLFTSSANLAVADVVKAAEKHKLVKYKCLVTVTTDPPPGVAIEDPNDLQGTTEMVIYADLRTARYREVRPESESIPDAARGPVRSSGYYVVDRTKKRRLGVSNSRPTDGTGAEDKRAVLSIIPNDELGAHPNRTTVEHLRDLETHKDAKVTKEGTSILYTAVDGKETTTLWVDTATMLPIRMVVEVDQPNQGVARLRIEFTDFEWDPELKGFKSLDDLFSLSPPEGYKLDDQTKEPAKGDRRPERGQGDVSPPKTLAGIIASVRKNEKLYQDIEVLMRSTYDIGDRPPTEEREVVRQRVQTRFVSQGEWFRLERKGGSQDAKATASMDRIRAFDGKLTRVLEQNAVGNFSAERLEDENFIRPHLLLLRYTRLAVPLSVYLSGDKAIQAHPNGRWNGNLKMEISYQGEHTFNDLKCHKVLVKIIQVKSGEVHDAAEYWLAEERNYLPVRHVTYTYRFSTETPTGEAVVHKFREVKPGVWFPIDVEVTAYNKFKIQNGGQREMQWRERHRIERVDLDPKYDREFFAKVDFPAGTVVYEVEKGKIIRSWRQD